MLECRRSKVRSAHCARCRAGQLPYHLAFDVLEYLPKERAHVPCNAAVANFHKLDLVLRHTRVYTKWKGGRGSCRATPALSLTVVA
ncbi:hypothetical protein IscW_ISCW002850 [Ixodes scapularis]|uniref:Uncharacterized protein n=1 Tax=Ixodes scapularis TaxID=6945 RepID=B7PAI7_IXOSC|nr:hypothetical protein IscW_ISCW002850 [Ixodes scapularis]|eukprot:XP_002406898.1 hypothetical protein IscW_ISCW002850 [Ixodes scapularis]